MIAHHRDDEFDIALRTRLSRVRHRVASATMAPRDAILRGLKRVIRHHPPVSVALYLLGLFGVLSYPWLARRTFIDENAFLHGQADVGFGADEANTARAHAERARRRSLVLDRDLLEESALQRDPPWLRPCVRFLSRPAHAQVLEARLTPIVWI